MQAKKRTDLAKRSRYYQGVIDSSLLKPGTPDFNALNDVCIIMIMPFDLFGEGKYFYSFGNICHEEKRLELQDGAVRIFLNTKGTNDHEVSRELVEFLHYIDTLDESIVESSESERLRKIHSRVNCVKTSEKTGVKYMQRWEEMLEVKLESRLETRIENSQKFLMTLLASKGDIPENLNTLIREQSNPDVLEAWFHLAIEVKTVDEFIERRMI